MILRILLGVACLTLLNTSQAEAQLFRRLRAQPQPQYQPQQQRYAPQTAAPQNGYQGRLTAAQRSRPLYIRRADGSVVPYYPNKSQQPATQAQAQAQAKLKPGQKVAAAPTKGQPNIVTTQGQLTPVRPTAQPRRQLSNVYSQPTAQPPVAPAIVAPVGGSVLNQPQLQTSVGSISPATAMPQAAIQLDPASSIPVSTKPTNPAPTGLSLSLADEVVPASADVEIEPTPASGAILDSNGQETFSVLETID